MYTSVQHASHALKTWMRSCAVSLVVVFLAGLAPTWSLANQTSAKPAATASKSRPKHHLRSTAHRARTAHSAPEPAPPPPKPDWPINNQPAPASITWDSHGLKIDASNSSLRQILSQVTSTTGVKVEGLGEDERVFGNYGPGDARDVLSQLLQGTGYNFLIMGEQAPGTPRQIVLSQRTAAASSPAAPAQTASDDDEGDSEVDDRLQAVPPPPNMQPEYVPGAPPRTPQQVMEEMQQRQRLIQQQMQQNQQNQQNQPQN